MVVIKCTWCRTASTSTVVSVATKTAAGRTLTFSADGGHRPSKNL